MLHTSIFKIKDLNVIDCTFVALHKTDKQKKRWLFSQRERKKIPHLMETSLCSLQKNNDNSILESIPHLFVCLYLTLTGWFLCAFIISSFLPNSNEFLHKRQTTDGDTEISRIKILKIQISSDFGQFVKASEKQTFWLAFAKTSSAMPRKERKMLWQQSTHRQ